jgi:hypothetical protein
LSDDRRRWRFDRCQPRFEFRFVKHYAMLSYVCVEFGGAAAAGRIQVVVDDGDKEVAVKSGCFSPAEFVVIHVPQEVATGWKVILTSSGDLRVDRLELFGLLMTA